MPLLWASYTNSPELIRLLLELKVDASLSNVIGQTPLHFAAAEGHSEVTTLLLEGGADPTVTDSQSLTPALLASRNNHLDLVELFTQRGVAINVSPAFKGDEVHFDDVAFSVVTFEPEY